LPIYASSLEATSTTASVTQAIPADSNVIRPDVYKIGGGVEISSDLAEGVTPEQAQVVVVATAATMVIPTPRRRIK
jgi:hypothetical protein